MSMPKWEYAAIVNAGSKWRLVKPPKPYRNNDVLSFYHDEHDYTEPNITRNLPLFYWQFTEHQENVLKDRLKRDKKFSSKDKSRNIIMSHPDLLCLINMAGDKGWEITGGIGLSDGEPGKHESKWRIMRREL